MLYVLTGDVSDIGGAMTKVEEGAAQVKESKMRTVDVRYDRSCGGSDASKK